MPATEKLEDVFATGMELTDMIDSVDKSGHQEGTRGSLVAAAADLFLERGFALSGIREIASRAGCNISMIKYCFGSKEGLLREIVQPGAESQWSSLEHLAVDDMPPDERLSGLVDEITKIFGANRLMIAIVAKEVIFNQPRMFPLFHPILSRNAERLISVVRRALDDAGMRGVDPRGVSLIIISAFIYSAVAEPVVRRVLLGAGLDPDAGEGGVGPDVIRDYVGPTMRQMLVSLVRPQASTEVES